MLSAKQSPGLVSIDMRAQDWFIIEGSLINARAVAVVSSGPDHARALESIRHEAKRALSPDTWKLPPAAIVTVTLPRELWSTVLDVVCDSNATCAGLFEASPTPDLAEELQLGQHTADLLVHDLGASDGSSAD